MLLDTSQLPQIAAASGTEEAWLPRGGPGDRQSTFQRAQPPHLVGPAPPLPQAQGGREEAGRTRVWETRRAPRPERANSGTQRAGPGRDSAGIEARRRRSSGVRPACRPTLPDKLVRSSQRFPQNRRRGLYFVSSFKSLRISGARSPGPRELLFPRQGLREPNMCPTRVSAALCAVSFSC